jgi:HEAT repeat protein
LAIKLSAARQIDALIAELSSNRASSREAAVARLTLLGTRTVGRLIALIESATPGPARAAALQALEAIASPRAIDVALNALDDEDAAVAFAAVSTAKTFLDSPRGADVIDRLTGVALDPLRQPDLRLAAIRGLSTLRPTTLKPVWALLAQDTEPQVRARAQAVVLPEPPAWSDAVADVSGAAEGPLPDDPVALARGIATVAASIPLLRLQRLVDRIREHEAAAPAGEEWTRVRAAAHLALAGRGSRLALYDLRESLERASAPLPVAFLAALSQIGDASCLESIAAAYVQAPASNGGSADWWKQHLVRAFHIIVEREGLTRRHQVIRKIAKRWGAATQELSGPAPVDRLRQ